jgi:hypothetical protein
MVGGGGGAEYKTSIHHAMKKAVEFISMATDK